MSDTLPNKRLGTIKDFWIGANSEWLEKMKGPDRDFCKMVKEDISDLLSTLDHYTVLHQAQQDEIDYLRNKYGRK